MVNFQDVDRWAYEYDKESFVLKLFKTILYRKEIIDKNADYYSVGHYC